MAQKYKNEKALNNPFQTKVGYQLLNMLLIQKKHLLILLRG